MKSELIHYKNGTDMSNFKHIPEISFYNHNFYIGHIREGKATNDLLFEKSDDFGRSEWYLLENKTFILIGESYETDEKLIIL